MRSRARIYILNCMFPYGHLLKEQKQEFKNQIPEAHLYIGVQQGSILCSVYLHHQLHLTSVRENFTSHIDCHYIVL